MPRLECNSASQWMRLSCFFFFLMSICCVCVCVYVCMFVCLFAVVVADFRLPSFFFFAVNQALTSTAKEWKKKKKACTHFTASHLFSHSPFFSRCLLTVVCLHVFLSFFCLFVCLFSRLGNARRRCVCVCVFHHFIYQLLPNSKKKRISILSTYYCIKLLF